MQMTNKEWKSARMLDKCFYELNSEGVWNRVEQMLADHLKNNNINMDASDLTDKLEWSVKVQLKK